MVSPSASCVGHGPRPVPARRPSWRSDPGLRAAVGRGSPPRVFELSEFLVDVLGVDDVGAYFPHRVTYHPTCHSLRCLRVGDAPLRLLRAVGGLDLVELPEPTSAAGSAAPSR